MAREVKHWNTLQHTVIHWNTLQQTATHCDTLQNTATICKERWVAKGTEPECRVSKCSSARGVPQYQIDYTF